MRPTTDVTDLLAPRARASSSGRVGGAPEAAFGDAPTADDAHTALQGAPILVVDDEPDNCELMRVILELEGFTVFTALSGAEALALLPTIPRPRLILLDVMMPGMDGLATLDRLRADRATSAIPVALWTACPDQVPAQALPRLRKPLDLDQLVELVTRAAAAA